MLLDIFLLLDINLSPIIFLPCIPLIFLFVDNLHLFLDNNAFADFSCLDDAIRPQNILIYVRQLSLEISS
jgi:hypothetical protein